MSPTKEPLRLVDGKFFRGRLNEPVEIGNREQIALLQAQERKLKELERELNDTGLSCKFSAEDVQYTSVLQFTCVCGKAIRESEVFFDVVSENLRDIDGDWDGAKVKCEKCNRKYRIKDGYAKLAKK